MYESWSLQLLSLIPHEPTHTHALKHPLLHRVINSVQRVINSHLFFHRFSSPFLSLSLSTFVNVIHKAKPKLAPSSFIPPVRVRSGGKSNIVSLMGLHKAIARNSTQVSLFYPSLAKI